MRAPLKAFTAAAIVIGLFLLAALVLSLSVNLIEYVIYIAKLVYPTLAWVFGMTLVISLFILLPLAGVRRIRGFAGYAIIISSCVFGLTLWVWALILTHSLWGAAGLIIGLVFAGVGVVPTAILATLINGMWSVFGTLILMTVLAFGSPFLGYWIIEKGRS